MHCTILLDVDLYPASMAVLLLFLVCEALGAKIVFRINALIEVHPSDCIPFSIAK